MGIKEMHSNAKCGTKEREHCKEKKVEYVRHGPTSSQPLQPVDPGLLPLVADSWPVRLRPSAVVA